MKTKKRFLSILLSLALVLGLMPGVSLTAYAADTTVTWNASDIVTVNPWDKSFTKDGITFAPGHADFLDKNFTNGGTFTTASGKFTKIEVTAPYVDISGTGWSGGSWTGDASSSVSYSGDIYDVGMGQLKIVFTIAPDAVAVTGVSLNKESTTLTVGGTETLTATVAPDNATDKTVTWTSSNTSVATVSNAGLVTAVAAGTATITVTATNGTADDTSDDKTATCAVTVNKADPTAPTGLTATYGQTLADVALPEGWSWADSTQSVGNVGDHTFKANFAGNDNYNATSNVDVTVTVGKADPTATAPAQADPITITWTASAITGYRSNPITIEGVTLTAGNIQDWNMPMIKGGGTFTTTLGNFTKIELNADWITDFSGTGWVKNGWQSQTWTGDAASVSYSGTIGGGGMTCDGGSMTITFTIAPAKQAQTITASDVTATYGDTGVKINASTTGDGGLSYAVRSGDTVTVDASGNLTINKAGSAVITVTAAETDTYAQATKDVNVTISTKAMTVSAEDVNATVDGQPHGITVTVTDPASGATVKYGTEAGSYTLDASPTQTEVGEKTVYYQVTSDNYTTYTGSAKVTVSAKQPQTITAENVTANYGDTGKSIEASTSGDGTLSYAVKSGDAVTVNETTGALTIVKAGSAVITVTASETATYAQATKEVTVTINKANAVPATVTANNRTYDGTEKPLVTVTGTPTGGEMQYALGTATEATEQYTTSIPTATEAGTYYVWYKVVGDANHNSTEPNSVEAKINPVDKTDLNTAIEEAEAYYESIKEDDVYAQVAEALKNAIDEAKKYTNDNVAEKEVKEAIETIKAAKDDAEEGKKEADDTVVANEVADAINALPASDKIATTDKDAIEAARKAYDALTDDQKAKVPTDTLKKLEAAEKALADAKQKEAEKEEADTEAAKKVTDAINALPASDKVATTDKAAIEAARKAYDALTADQKTKVPADTLKKLEAAEKALAAAEKKTADDAKKPEGKNEWIDGQWYGADGNTEYKAKGSWKQNDKGWWYEDTDGWYPKSQWQKIDGKWYYFTADGYMDYSEYRDGYWLGSDGAWDETYSGGHWMQDSTGWWYVDSTGWYPVNQYLWVDGVQYWFNANGYWE